MAGLWCYATVSILFLLVAFGTHAADFSRHTLSGHVPPVTKALKPFEQLPATNTLYLAIGLPLRNQAGLAEFQRQLYDPYSTNFHKYLTSQQFTARFGPTGADYEAVKEFARTNSLTIVEIHDDRILLDVSGSAANVERAFQIKFQKYHHPSEARDFFAPDAEPSVPVTLPVVDIQGLSDFARPHPMIHTVPNTTAPGAPESHSGSAPGGGGQYFGGDFRAAYVPGTTLTGSNQVVGLVQFDGFYSNDIASYEAQAGIPAVFLQTNLLDGFSGTPTTGANSGNPEVSLDIEMVIAMAPGISKIIIYEGNPNNFIPNDVLSQIASDDLCPQVSSSWSWNGGPSATTDSYLIKMITQGQSVFFASGDSDAYTGANAPDTTSNFTTPITSTNVTAVGATTLSTSGPLGAWTGETVWNWNNSGRPNVGSSGGTSTYYTIPWWQLSTTTSGNNRSTTFRNFPDVALTGDNVYVYYGSGSVGTFGGTSCAAPLWAGFTALVNQQAALASKPPVGFLSPALYRLAAGPNYNSLFHDTTSGNNIGTNTAGLYNAVTGFDLCTGLGTPNGTNLINALAVPVPEPMIIPGGWSLLAESATPTNGAIDPGETVTVSFTLRNFDIYTPSNLVATLLPSANILAPGSPQSYGVLAASGGSASRSFTFTAAGACGSTITAAMQLQDGTNNLGIVSFNLPLGASVAVQSFAENFDEVTVPVLPSGWTSANLSGTSQSWTTVNNSADTAPNSAFVSDISSSGENALVSPVIAISSANAQLTFRHNFSFDYRTGGFTHARDGGVLQIQIGGSGFTDIVSAGGSFVTGGYNGSISSSSNPLGMVSAWIHASSGWSTVTVNLPSSAAGQNIQLQWVEGTDSSNSGGSGAVGWNVDSISITDHVANCLSVVTDLAISQSLPVNSYQIGQNLAYTLTVTNLGPQAAANLVVTDTIPANATFVSAPGGTFSGGTVVFAGSVLPANSATNFTLTLAPASGTTFTNVASTATITPESRITNNSTTLVISQVTAGTPIITAPPSAQAIQCGSNASFSVTATGNTPLNYQWSLDGVAISGATTTNLLLTNVHLPSHIVAVIVTNTVGAATSSVPLTVQDTLPPVITLNGANPLHIELGNVYAEAGASAFDVCAGVLPVNIAGTVNTNSVSTNTVTYTANDGNGNTNITTRTVIVQDTTPPVIQWSFTNLVLSAGSNCVAAMPNVTGTNDIIATDASGSLIITQSPTNNTALPLGTNVVVITVADASGNKSFSTNSIVVLDTTPPVITVKGSNPMTNELGSAFTDPGISVSDTCSGVALAVTNGTVNINIVGTNFLTYTAVDGSGNTNTVTRTVVVLDRTPPVIAWAFTNLVLAADSNCVAAMPDITGTNYVLASDLSGVAAISQSPTNGAVLSLGTNIVLIAASDIYSNTAFATNAIIVQDESLPVILFPPQSQTNSPGTTATFSIGATACSPLTYQWMFNAGPLAAQTNNTLVLSNLNFAAAGNYSVAVIGAGGSVTSVVATLTVYVPPGISSVTENSNGSILLNLSGTPGSSYVLQGATNLTSPVNWYPISTNTPGTNGLWLFTDLQATNFTLEFYRLMLVQ